MPDETTDTTETTVDAPIEETTTETPPEVTDDSVVDEPGTDAPPAEDPPADPPAATPVEPKPTPKDDPPAADPPAADPKAEQAAGQQAAAEQQQLQELVSDYKEFEKRLDITPGEKNAFDIIDDGPKAIRTSMKLVGVLAKRVATLEGEAQTRTAVQEQQSAAEKFWASDYAKSYGAVPVEQGKALWTETQQWAASNKRSHEQAIARWETLMEGRVAGAKKPTTTATTRTPVQVRTTGKPTPSAKTEEETAGGGNIVAKVSHKALKALGW